MYEVKEKDDLKNIENLYSSLKQLNHEYKELNKKTKVKKNYVSILLSSNPKRLLETIRLKLAIRKINDIRVSGKTQQVESNPFNDERIAVYTSTFGGTFHLWEPFFKPDNCDFFYIGDKEVPKESIWKKYEISNFVNDFSTYSNIEKNRYVKMNPHHIFKEYRFSVYIDGNIRLFGDPTEFVNLIGEFGIAMHKHRSRNCVYDELMAIETLRKMSQVDCKNFRDYLHEEGMPTLYGLSECNIIARDHSNTMAIKMSEEWWDIFLNGEAKRDQVSFPLIAFRNGVEMASLMTLGSNVYDNDIIRIESLEVR